MIFLKDVLRVFKDAKIWKEGCWMPLTEGYCKEFDLDLKFGKMGEEYVQDIFEGDSLVEVKTERDIWKTTKNIAIEIRYKGQPSGLSTTKSNTWIHLLSYNGEIEGGLIFNVPKLKKRIKELLRGKIAHIKMGGDDNQSQLVLIPIQDVWDYQLSSTTC